MIALREADGALDRNTRIGKLDTKRLFESLDTTNELLQSLIEQLSQLERKYDETNKQLNRISEHVGGMRTRVSMLSQMSLVSLRKDLQEMIFSKQLGYLDTLETIQKNRMSFSRFGDGEFLLISDYERHLRFQRNSPGLQKELAEVLMAPSPNLLVGLPDRSQTLHWERIWPRVWPKIEPLIPKNTIFGNADVSRRFCFELHGRDGVQAWRRIWNDRDVTLVYGAGSRFTAIPELFDGVKSIRRIESEPTNAYSDLDRLATEITEANPDIVLIALGPAATVLSKRLCESGIQALDIGHLSSSYSEHFSDGPVPEATPLSR